MSVPDGFVSTRSSRLGSELGSAVGFENVTFTSHKRSRNVGNNNKVNGREVDNIARKDVDMKKLRYEVIKFGTSGMDRTQKEASSIALAVALGAKPPKRKYQNYKEILAAKKATKKEPTSNTTNQWNQSKTRHMYVVGNKVIPAKPKAKDGPKNFLEKYGKAGRSKFKKGPKKMEDN